MRWASFDCYGTLVDWNGGIATTFARLWPGAPSGALLRRYHEIEPEVESGTGRPYREVMAETLRCTVESAGLEMPPGEENALADALPGWDVFPEVPGELWTLRERDWSLAILSNTDP